MQSRNLLLLILVSIISPVFLSSCIIPSSLRNAYDFRKSNIKLKVVSENGIEALEIKEHEGSKCNNNKKGCIKAKKGTTAMINFHLIASSDWHLTEMKICLGEEKPTVCSLQEADIGQFSAGASRTSPRSGPDSGGVINLTALSGDLSKFNLLDLNTFSEDYFYMIKACKKNVAEDVCVTLDPPIENEGGTRNRH